VTPPLGCVCGQPAIVRHTMNHRAPCCLQCASAITCQCGHPASRCPILGCGDWIAVDASADHLLMIDFQFIVTPQTMRH
jgi:hypothetical protein